MAGFRIFIVPTAFAPNLIELWRPPKWYFGPPPNGPPPIPVLISKMPTAEEPIPEVAPDMRIFELGAP